MAGIEPTQDAINELQRDITTGRVLPPLSLRDVDPSLPSQAAMAYFSAGLVLPAPHAHAPAVSHAQPAVPTMRHGPEAAPVQVSLEQLPQPSATAGLLQGMSPDAAGVHGLQANVGTSSGGDSTNGGNDSGCTAVHAE